MASRRGARLQGKALDMGHRVVRDAQGKRYVDSVIWHSLTLLYSSKNEGGVRFVDVRKNCFFLISTPCKLCRNHEQIYGK